ncbi:MAG: hypothetical protein HQ523_07240 [Lentisphaerae bacterium]|nr:hypothetical protein [Lentisphaerota bacterium]
MSVAPLSILGGESVYCINQNQLGDAMRLANEDEESSPRIQAVLADVELALTRNERAALAFVIIERLREPIRTADTRA